MKKSLLPMLLLAGSAAAGTDAPKLDARQLEETRAITKTLSAQLGGRLKQELEANGPASAVSVCKKIAPQIAGDLSRQTGWTVSRVGTRARNAETGVADAWEAKALTTFSERMKHGEKPETMELAEVVTAPSGKPYLHYAKAIAVQPMCLACHGGPGELAEGVRARLQTEYPLDQATGYRAGELRGAAIVRRPL